MLVPKDDNLTWSTAIDSTKDWRFTALTKAEWDNVIDESKTYWFTVTTMDEYNSILDFNNGSLQPFARNKGRPMSEELIIKSTMNSAGK